MGQATDLPAFIKVGITDDSLAFRQLETAADKTGSYLKQRFERDMADIQGIVRNALTLPAGASGALNIDTSGMRQAAAQAEITARATRDVAQAMEAAANAAGDYSAATRRNIQVAQAAAHEAEEEARALTQKAAVYERVQAQLNRTGAETTAYAGANRRLADSQRQVNQASIGAVQQLQDIGVSLYGGQKAGVVFAQQLPQLAFALTALEGSTNKTAASVGKFATFLSGPWGLAVGLAVGVAGTLTAGLFENAEATDAVEDAHKALEKSLSDISTFFDLATGAINRQNEALIANARLKRLDERDALRKAIAGNQARGRGLVEGSMRGDVSFGGTFGNETGRVAVARSGPSDLVRAIQSANGDQVKMGAELVKLARGQGENASRARALLDLMGEDANNRNRLRELSLEEESLRTGKLASDLMQTKKAPRSRSSSADRELKAAQAIEDAVTSSANAVANLRSQFDEAPRDIDRAAKAALDFKAILTDIDRREKAGKRTAAEKAKDEETKRLIADAEARILPAFRQKAVDDRIKSADKELQLQRLTLLGRTEEAEKLAFTQDLMRQLNVHTEEQLQTELRSRNITEEKLALMYDQQKQLIENERIQARMDRSIRSVGAKLQELDRARSSVESAIASLPDDARGALKGLVGNLRGQINDIIARRIADGVFGNMFAALEDEIRGKKPIDAATENYVGNTVKASTALIDLTESFLYASGVFGGAANDNMLVGKGGNDALASAIKAAAKSAAKDYEEKYDPYAEIVVTGSKSKATREQRQIADATERSAKSLKDLARGAAEGAFIGQSASGLLFGNKSNALGSAVGGALGKFAGEALGKALGGTLGEAAGPIGSIAGGLLGSVVGNLIGGTKKGSATIGGSGSDLSVASYTGNSARFKQAAGTGADSAIATINRIADMLGADVNASAGRVSIGIRDGKYRVDTSGRGITKVKKGAIDFGDDAEAAIRAATMDLIKDRVLTGLRASTQRLLQQGKDLDAALQKALDFESVFSRLKEYDDPVGAALDTLDKEFQRLQKIFVEAGASAAEFADLERLYGLERAKAIEEATNRVAGSLKDLYGELTIGDNGKSLRDRLSAAQAAYDPLKARVAAGDRSAYDAFAKAAQELLGIQREFSGSQSPYFSLLEEVTQLTKAAIDREANIASIATGRDTPFGSTGGANPSYQPVVSAIDRTNDILIEGFRAMLGASNDNNPNLGGAGFALPRMS